MSAKGKKEVDIAEKIGKAQQKPKKKSVSTTTVLVVIMGVVLAFVGFAFFAPSEKEGAAPASYQGVCHTIHEQHVCSASSAFLVFCVAVKPQHICLHSSQPITR